MSRFSSRYPYLTGLAWLVILLIGFAYVASHQWMFHPWEMTVAWLTVLLSIIRLCSLLISAVES